MISTVLFGLLLISQLVVSQVEIIDPPSGVTACFGGRATLSCFVQFDSGMPSGANWFQGSGTNASSLPNHMLLDNSSSSTAPAIVNNTLLITNISFDVGSERTYFCQQGSEMSDTATLTTIGPPTGTIIPGVPTLGSGNSNSIPLQLSYGNANFEDEIVTGIEISWTDNDGNTGSDTLDASTSSYTIMGLSPSTQYNVTLIAFNQCGNGPENVANLLTDDGSGPTTPSTATDDSTTGSDDPTTDSTNRNNNQTAVTNPTDSPGAAIGMKCNITAFCFMAAIVMMI